MTTTPMSAALDRLRLEVARRVGYDSEEAFSRAFKRAYGLAPMHWRGSHSPVRSAGG
jgi:AraC-like DNA-binding protein